MPDSAEAKVLVDIARGQGSFCIPRPVLDALLDAKANAYEICTYLVLARFTDASGQYSTASISAVNRYTGANKVRGGPVDRAIQRLKSIHVTRTHKVPNRKSGRPAALVDQVEDLGSILMDRTEWLAQFGTALPDGPTDRGTVLFVLPDFGEQLSERVWFGGNLVKGTGNYQPLKELKNAGDVAARLLLVLYMAQDMETWGGVKPVGNDCGPWYHYKPIGEAINIAGNASLFRAKSAGPVLSINVGSRTWKERTELNDYWAEHSAADGPIWAALSALESSGLVYQVVMVLNRNALKSKFASGNEYHDIPADAEPLYELDCLSMHGFKPEGEEGIGAATAKTAGELGHSVALESGRFDGTYAAIVRAGHPAMIAGVLRLRFRVANAKNAGVKGAWARIHQGNRDGIELLQRVRSAKGLEPLPNLTPKKRTSKESD